MKTNFLKIEKPCAENWSDMTPNERGRFCKLCAKNVIDLTQASPLEIAKAFKGNKKLCVRVTNEQLKTPLVDLNNYHDYKLPYAKVAAGLMLATTLTSQLGVSAQKVQAPIEITQTTEQYLNPQKHLAKGPSNKEKPIAYTKFKGIVYSEEGIAIENAKISFITIDRILSTYTVKGGAFSLDIPNELIDDDNVIRVSYNSIKNYEADKKLYYRFETKDYVLSQKEMRSNFGITAVKVRLMLGGLAHYPINKTPVVISNGRKIKYKDFMNARLGKKSSCSLEIKDLYYFEPEPAIAIYGMEAKYGLYLLFEE